MNTTLERTIIKNAINKAIDEGEYYTSPFELTNGAKKYVQGVVEAVIKLDNALSENIEDH